MPCTFNIKGLDDLLPIFIIRIRGEMSMKKKGLIYEKTDKKYSIFSNYCTELCMDGSAVGFYNESRKMICIIPNMKWTKRIDAPIN